jgi:hypothetical protein
MMRSFAFYIHHQDSSTPGLIFEVATDEARACELAQRALEESTNRLAVEVRENDALLFSVDRNGVTWGELGRPHARAASHQPA